MTKNPYQLYNTGFPISMIQNNQASLANQTRFDVSGAQALNSNFLLAQVLTHFLKPPAPHR